MFLSMGSLASYPSFFSLLKFGLQENWLPQVLKSDPGCLGGWVPAYGELVQELNRPTAGDPTVGRTVWSWDVNSWGGYRVLTHNQIAHRSWVSHHEDFRRFSICLLLSSRVVEPL